MFFFPLTCPFLRCLLSLVSPIFDPTKDDYSFLLFLNQRKEGSYIHVGDLVKVQIDDHPKNPKIVYVNDVLIESKHDLTMSILVEYRN